MPTGDIREGQDFALDLDGSVVKAAVAQVGPGSVAVQVRSPVEPWAVHLNVAAEQLDLRWADHEDQVRALLATRARLAEQLERDTLGWEERAVRLASRLADRGGHGVAQRLLGRLDRGEAASHDFRLWVDELEELLGHLRPKLGQQRLDNRDSAA
ncbi:MAG: hypothetical protein ACRDZW_06325 [Acidimicrobiales bacterium]